MSQTDAMLFENWVRERNADAFKTLSTRYAAMVYQTCRRVLNDPSEAEDVAQECFLTLAATHKPVGDYLAPWLHRVAYNRSLARLRSERRRRDREVRFASACESSAEMEWNEISECVDAAIAELPDKLRAPVVAYFLDGQTHEAIARTLGIPRSTVTYRIDRGIEGLRKSIKTKGVAIAGIALAETIKANVAVAAPSSLFTSLGKLALSGAGHVPVPATLSTAPLWGFLTAKTLVAGAASLAIAAFAGWQVVERVEGKSAPVSANAVQTQPSKGPVHDNALAAVPVGKDREKVVSEAQTPTSPDAATSEDRSPAPVTASAPEDRIKVAQSGIPSLSQVGSTISNAWDSLVRTVTGENGRRVSCQNNLKQFGLVFKMFANESPGQCWPLLDPRPGHLIFANASPGSKPVYPTYLKVPQILICPDDTAKVALVGNKQGVELLDQSSYFYLGYVVRSNAELEAFADAYKERTSKGLAFDADLDTPLGKLYRLREGVEQLLITDPNNPAAGAKLQSEIPVFIEASLHNPKGGNILYMDGHVEFRRLMADDSSFPMNNKSMDILNALARRP
jgi:RNA polymerase sigma factor (sigma-70 family)